MRFHEINEAIENRPRYLKLFLQNRIKELTAIDRQLKEATKTIKQSYSHDGMRMLEYWLSYAGYDNYSDLIADSERYSRAYAQERDMPVETVARSLKNYLDYGDQFGFRQHILDTYKYMDPIPELSDFKNAELGASKYGYVEGDPDNLKDEEYVSAMGILKGFRMLKQAIDAGKKVLDLIKRKITVISDIRAATYNDNYRPAHEEQETLFHASAFCPEILESGFLEEKPIERAGLGNFGSQATISFTHDLEIARNIMRCFKDIWAITHGQVTARTIIGWGKAEGIEKNMADQHGGQPGFHWVKSLEDTVLLYTYYLAFSKIRVNPVLVNSRDLVNMMKDRKQSDIGVLACEVKLEPTDEYKIGESEFRLPADRVISVARKF